MKLVPRTPAAIRITALFNRSISTGWAEKEVKKYRELLKGHCFDTFDDLALIERYYAFERRKPKYGNERGCHRRDLYTFLGNYHGELDRAREWEKTHPAKPVPRKIIPIPVKHAAAEPPRTPEETAEFLAQYKRLMGRLPRGYEEEQAQL